MTPEQLQAIKDRCERNQGRNDGMIRQDVRDLLTFIIETRSALLDADSNMSFISCRYGNRLQQLGCPITKEELYDSALKCRALYEKIPKEGLK